MRYAIVFTLLSIPGLAQVPASSEGADFFENKVRPVLADNCYDCHTAAESGGLRVDSRANLLKGGKSGPAVMPGDPDKSLLIQAVKQTGDLKMPKGGKLKPQEVQALVDWVKMGAPWPETSAAPAPAVKSKNYTISPEQRAFWSFQPLKDPAPPAVKEKSWAKTDIDKFILAKLESQGLKPVPAADRRTLIRRATLDLIGLPPTAEEVDALNVYEASRQGMLRALRALAAGYPASPVQRKARALEIKLTTEKDELLKLLSAYNARYPDDSAMALAYGLLLKERSSPRAEQVLSELYSGAGSHSAEALQALGRKPTPLELLAHAGNLARAARYAQAERELEEALPALDSASKEEALNLLAKTLFYQKKYSEAATTYLQTANTYRAARAFFRGGDEASFTNAVAALEKDKDRRAGYLVLALAEKKRRGGETADSLKLFDRVKQSYPELKEEALWESGWLCYRQKDYAGALSAFSELSEKSDNPGYLYWKARAMEHLGEKPDAIWEKLKAGSGYYTALATLRTNIPPPKKTKDTGTSELQAALARSGKLDFTRARILSEAGLKDEALFEVMQQIEQCSQPGDFLEIIYELRDMGQFKRALRIALLLPGKLQPQDVIYPKAFWKEVESAAGRYSLDPLLLLSVIREESRFDPSACSPAGAIGLMQLMPQTATRCSVRLNMESSGASRKELMDPGTNLAYGGYYLKRLIGEMGSLPAALAAYNAGRQAVKSWLEEGKYPSSDEFIEDIPYSETKNYVKRIITSYFYYRQQEGEALEAMSF
jgi:soluble lytic murein transglycosylase